MKPSAAFFGASFGSCADPLDDSMFRKSDRLRIGFDSTGPAKALLRETVSDSVLSHCNMPRPIVLVELSVVDLLRGVGVGC